MPTCNACGAEHETDELDRHTADGRLTVHCPDCSFVMGRYREPGLRDP